jgi:hypothetical protein
MSRRTLPRPKKLLRRVEAIKAGHAYYFSGRPCKNGNVALRRVSDAGCLCDACVEQVNERNARQYAARVAKKKQQEAA